MRGDLGELLGGRLLVHERVGHEDRVLGQHQRVERGERRGAGLQPDHVADVAEMEEKVADEGFYLWLKNL